MGPCLFMIPLRSCRNGCGGRERRPAISSWSSCRSLLARPRSVGLSSRAPPRPFQSKAIPARCQVTAQILHCLCNSLLLVANRDPCPVGMIRTGVRNISDTNQEGSVGARRVKYRSREINIINAGITIHGNTVRSKARLRRTPFGTI